MRPYREQITITATTSGVTGTALVIASGYIRVYEGRVVENKSANSGIYNAFLGAIASGVHIGAADLVTANNNPAEETGRRNFFGGEYWTFTVSSITTGAVIVVNFFGTEYTVFEYEKGLVTP